MTNPHDWRDRLQHLQGDGKASKAGDPETKKEPKIDVLDEHNYRAEQLPDLIAEPAAESSGMKTSLSFSASRKGKPQPKVTTPPSDAAGGGQFSANAIVANVPLTTEELLKQLDKISPEQLLAAHKKQKQTIVFAVAGVILLVVITVATMPLKIPEVTNWCTKVCFLAVPLCIIFCISEAVKMLMKKAPLKAQKLHSLTSWGDSRDIAFSYIDTADYLMAEKVLEKACKKMSAKQAKQYISAYGLLGVIHAYTGRTDAAEKIIRQAVEISEANYKVRQTDSNALLLAITEL